MPEPLTVAEAYLATWNAAAPDERAAHLAGWAEDASYVDPLMQARGREGIGDMIAAARAQFPGQAFTLQGVPDGHGDHVRLSWALAPHDGRAIVRGTDVVHLDSEGRIATVVGFLDGGER